MVGGVVYHRSGMWITLALLLSIGISTSAHAGVGMLSGNESLYNSDLSFAGGNTRWDPSRQMVPSACKRRNARLVQGYEYGYSYFYTVFADVALVYKKCGEINRRARINRAGVVRRPALTLLGGQSMGVGDVKIGVRARLNHNNTAAWEGSLVIPTGYDALSPSRLGRGALGLGLGIRFASDGSLVRRSSWGWRFGSTYTYFFASKGNSLATNASVDYAFTESNFEQTGNFASLRINNSFSFGNGGVQRTLFFNGPIPRSLTNSDVTSISLSYSHAFKNGWSTNARIGKAFFGRSSPVDYTAGWGVSYRWEE